MANTYKVTRVTDNGFHHNNKWGVYKTPAHSPTGKEVFVFAGDKAEERATFLCDMFNRERTGDDERFLQRILSGDKAADEEVRALVGAKPRARGIAA